MFGFGMFGLECLGLECLGLHEMCGSECLGPECFKHLNRFWKVRNVSECLGLEGSTFICLIRTYVDCGPWSSMVPRQGFTKLRLT